MTNLSEQELLRDYAARRSEAAFVELVQRHVDLVYSAALRMVCDAHLAEDVTQSVFLALAQNAGQLADRPVLAGWLHRTAQNIAAQTVRTEVRRHAREQEAASMNELLSAGPDAAWEHIAPQLDAALGELDDSDRDALLLRYFGRKSAQEMAAILGISSEAAQKRVNRAVDRLRELFAKRGVAIGAAALIAIISANAIQAAPASLAAAIIAAGLAGTALAATTAATTTKAIAMTTLQKSLVAASLAIAAGAGLFELHQASQLSDQLLAVRHQQAAQTEQWEQERAQAKNKLAALSDENSRLKSGQGLLELLKLRGEVGRLRQQSASDKSQAKSVAKNVADLMSDPASKELARVQLRQTLKNKYTPLIRQLNLSPDASDKFFTTIIEAQMNEKDSLARLLSGDLDVQTALQGRDNARTDLQNQLTALLGEPGYAQYDQFNRDSNAAELVSGLNRELGDNTLNDEQARQLQELFAAKPEITADDMDLFRSKESLDALFQSLVDRGHQDMQQAANFLTPQQLNAAYVIQSNYFNTIRTQLTLGQQLVNQAAK